MRCTQSVASLLLSLLLLSSCRGLLKDQHDLTLFPRGSSPEPHSFADPKGKGKADASEGHGQSTGLLGDVVRQALSRPASHAHPSETTHSHSSQGPSAHTAHPSQTSQAHATHPTHDSHSAQAVHSQATLGGRLSRLVAGIPPAGSYSRKVREKANQVATSGGEKPARKVPGPKKGNQVATSGVEKPARKVPGPKKGHGHWWTKPMSRPPAQPGSGKYYETKKRYRERMKAKKLESQGPPDQTPTAKQQHHQGEPGSPDAGTHAVSRRDTDSVLAVRGSGSRSSSPSSPKGKAPAHQDEYTGLLGDVVRQGQRKPATSHPTGLLEDVVHQATARRPSHGHASHSLPVHLSAHQNQVPHTPPAHPKKPNYSSRPDPGHEEHGGRLGHIVAGLRPLSFHPRKASKQKTHDLGVSGAKSAEEAQSLSKMKWWKRPQSRPPAQYGTDKYYETRKRWREKKKEKKAKGLEPPAEHPSNQQKHPPGGPGSPGAGSHAVGRRRRSGAGD